MAAKREYRRGECSTCAAWDSTDCVDELVVTAPPPDWLSARAKKTWWVVDDWLKHVRANVDEGLLAAYCEAYDHLIQAEKMIQADGLLITNPKRGYRVKHPAVAVANQCRISLAKLANELGLSPSGRRRLGWVIERGETADGR